MVVRALLVCTSQNQHHTGSTLSPTTARSARVQCSLLLLLLLPPYPPLPLLLLLLFYTLREAQRSEHRIQWEELAIQRRRVGRGARRNARSYEAKGSYTSILLSEANPNPKVGTLRTYDRKDPSRVKNGVKSFTMIETNDFYYFFNPHTGSRSMKGAWRELGFKIPSLRTHHQNPTDVPHDKPWFATIREPIAWAYSHYWPRFHHSLRVLGTPEPVWDVFEGRRLITAHWAELQDHTCARLNIYHDTADFFFLLEDGYETIFSYLGYQAPVLRRDGNNDHLKKKYYEIFSSQAIKDHRAYLANFFAEDIELYLEWRSKWRSFTAKDVRENLSRTVAAVSDFVPSAGE